MREFLAKMEKENDKMATCKTMIKMANFEKIWSLMTCLDRGRKEGKWRGVE